MTNYSPDFPGMTKEEIDQYLRENQFMMWRQLESGEYIGILPLMFTFSVCMQIERISPYAYRWCFQDFAEALHFYETAKEFDEVPTVRTSLKGHRYRHAPLLIEKDERGFDKW